MEVAVAVEAQVGGSGGREQVGVQLQASPGCGTSGRRSRIGRAQVVVVEVAAVEVQVRDGDLH